MCTTIFFESSDGRHFLGRTLDFAQLPDCGLIRVPAGAPVAAMDGHAVYSRYAFMGMASAEHMTMMADGVNEHGLGGAVQYIRDGAVYQDRKAGAEHIPAIELLFHILGRCKNVEEVAEMLLQVRVVGLPDPVFRAEAPVHHMFTDRTGACVVVEYTADGPDVMENPVGVMTNNPSFRWHLTNLKMQAGTVPYSLHETRKPPGMIIRAKGVTAQPIPQPGDYSSPSRFIRSASLTGMIHRKFPAQEAAVAGIHVLESLSIARGTYFLNGEEQYTQYLALIPLETPGYWFKTYYDMDLKRFLLYKAIPSETPALLSRIRRAISADPPAAGS